MVSVVACSKSSLRACGHGGDMAGGAELSGSTEPAVRGRKRQRKERGMEKELTGSVVVASASSGRHQGRRMVIGDLGGPRWKKMVLVALQCVRGVVARP